MNDEGARQSPRAHNRDRSQEPTTPGSSLEHALVVTVLVCAEIEACA